MVYIIVLNWKGATDTINCIKSILKLEYKNYKVVVCDNDSPDDSYQRIHDCFVEMSNDNVLTYCEVGNYVESDKLDAKHKDSNFFLIQTGKNFGFSGGNNIGIKYALKHNDLQYAWVLNNDTEVARDSLTYLVDKMEHDKNYGICGSKLVYFHDKTKIQGVGGKINKMLCTSSHLYSNQDASTSYDESAVESKIDYVIGASMFISSTFINEVGLLCEDYFLYYEEIDICNRARLAGYKIGYSDRSIVYHKEGASTEGGRSDVTDYFFVKNRVLIANKFYKKYVLIVKLSLVYVIFKRMLSYRTRNLKSYFSFFFI